MPAIAAALTFLSTPALAQEVPAQSAPPTTQPAPEPAPVTIAPAPVTVDTAPPADTSAPAATDTATIPDTATAAPVAKAKPKTKTVARTAAKAAPVKTAPKLAHAAPAAVAPVAAAPVAAPVASTPAIVPIVNTQAPPQATPAKSAAKQVTGVDERTMELGGGALALLALGAGAFALSRRRRDEEIVDDDTYVTEPMAEPEPMVASAPMVEAAPVASGPRHDPVADNSQGFVAPEISAFSWGNKAPETAARDDDGSDRNDGETWVERAYRGPSPANPSYSLKNRLRRAAFFDKRERDVAAGTAEPVDAGAGLPDAMMEEQERELA